MTAHLRSATCVLLLTLYAQISIATEHQLIARRVGAFGKSLHFQVRTTDSREITTVGARVNCSVEHAAEASLA
jgi:hypothetical protein